MVGTERLLSLKSDSFFKSDSAYLGSRLCHTRVCVPSPQSSGAFLFGYIKLHMDTVWEESSFNKFKVNFKF